MATDLERLVVSLEANIKKYESSLRKAMGDTNKSAKSIEDRFNRMNRNLANSFGRVGALAGGVLSAAGAKELLDSAARIDNALKVAGLSGAELDRVYQDLYASAQRNAAPVEALATLYGRLALTQKELGLSSADLTRFTDNVAVALKVSGKSSAEASGALLQLSQALGGGVVRAEEFNSILEGAPTIAQAAAAGIEEAGGSVAKLRQLVVDGEISSRAFFLGFQAGADGLRTKAASMDTTISQAFTNLKNAAINAAREIDQTSNISGAAVNGINGLALAVERLATAYQALAKWINATHTGKGVADLGKRADDLWNNPSWRNLVRFLEPGAERLLFGSVEDKSVQARIEGVQKLATEMRSVEQLRNEGLTRLGGVAGPSRFDDAFSPFAPKPIKASDYKPESTGGGSAARLDTFERAIAQAERRTAVLNAETAAIDLGAAATERARIVTELETAAKRANEVAGLKNTEVTEAQRLSIERVANAYFLAAEAAERANSPLRNFAREARNTGRMLEEAALGGLQSLEDGLVDIISDTENVADAFKRMAASIINDLARIAIRQAVTGPLAGALGGLFGGGGGGAVNMFGGAGANFPVPTFPRFARGTNFAPGGMALVGEQGPELVNLPRGSQVIPNNRLGGVTAPISIAIDARGADEAAIARLERSVTQLKATMPAQVVAAVRQAQTTRNL